MQTYLAAFHRIFHSNVSSVWENLRSGLSASSVIGTPVAEGGENSYKYTMASSLGLFASAAENKLETA